MYGDKFNYAACENIYHSGALFAGHYRAYLTIVGRTFAAASAVAT
jgi:hypothetical protein